MRHPVRPIPELTDDERSYVMGLIGPALDNGCMPWLGAPFYDAKVEKGHYGTVSIRNLSWAAHRIVYTVTRGEIPDGYHIDHICGFATCVNPEHLEAVTPYENARREGPRYRARRLRAAAEIRAKTSEASAA